MMKIALINLKNDNKGFLEVLEAILASSLVLIFLLLLYLPLIQLCEGLR